MSDPTKCYCGDPITPHDVLPEWDCTCDGACRSDCLCHQDIEDEDIGTPEERAEIEAALDAGRDSAAERLLMEMLDRDEAQP